MIGQTAILKSIDALIAGGNFPQFCIIKAPEGHGKKLVVEYIAEQLHAEIYKTEQNKVDDIRAIIKNAQATVGNRVYFLEDADDMTVQAQNAILKIAEEPPKNVYIILTMVDVNYSLPTILSRAKLIELNPYSRAELITYISRHSGMRKSEVEDVYADLLDISINMGMVTKLRMNDYDEILEFCKKISTNIGKISILNTFNIPRYLEGGGKGEEYNLEIFLMLLGSAFTVDYPRAKVIAKYRPLFRNKGINKHSLVLMMLLEMKGAYTL